MQKEKHLLSFQYIDLVYIPVLSSKDFYLLVLNLHDVSLILMDNKCKIINDYDKVPYIIGKLFGKYLNSIKHKNAKEIYKVEPKKADFKLSTEKNHTDSGVFLMRHMDTYMGENIREYHCGIFAECSGQVNQIKVLRRKYVTRILLSELNLKKEDVLKEANHFHYLRKEEKDNLLDYAIKNWNNRGLNIY